MKGRVQVVVPEVIEIVPSSVQELAGLRSPTRLWSLSRYDASDDDIIKPRDWLKWVRGSKALRESPKSGGSFSTYGWPCLRCCRVHSQILQTPR